jgi:putative glutamine amidotransferase
MARRPIVLLTPDLDTRTTHRGPIGYVQVQRYYTDRIVDEGGVPLLPPPLHHLRDADTVLDQLIALADALVISGGGHDVDPSHYGEERIPECGPALPERTDFEFALLKRAERKGLPVLGICGGMQLMNVARGGTLFQALEVQRKDSLGHTMKGEKTRTSHDVDIVGGTRLASIVGDGAACTIGVNSTHHQAVKDTGRGLIVSARAKDGLVEGIEDPVLPFYVGVQWHPEAVDQGAHRAIYRALLSAAATRIGNTR